jgi:hypothetical protein
MKRVYPQATYGDTQVVQLFFNLKSPSAYAPFLLFLLPSAWTAAMLRGRRYQVESWGVAMVTAAVLFLGMWVVVGKIAEVRIFLPFALALAPLTAELAMQRFVAEPAER